MEWQRLMAVGKIHAFSVLQPGYDPRTLLNFEICLHDLDMIELALARCGKVRAGLIQRQVTVVGLDEVMNGG